MPADGRIPVKVTFSEPGTYILRALADDGPDGRRQRHHHRDEVRLTHRPHESGAAPAVSAFFFFTGNAALIGATAMVSGA